MCLGPVPGLSKCVPAQVRATWNEVGLLLNDKVLLRLAHVEECRWNTVLSLLCFLLLDTTDVSTTSSKNCTCPLRGLHFGFLSLSQLEGQPLVNELRLRRRYCLLSCRCHRPTCTVLDHLGEVIHAVLWEPKPLPHNRRVLTNPSAPPHAIPRVFAWRE